MRPYLEWISARAVKPGDFCVFGQEDGDVYLFEVSSTQDEFGEYLRIQFTHDPGGQGMVRRYPGVVQVLRFEVDPDEWYEREVVRMKERAPA
jgi:hypothetical protein